MALQSVGYGDQPVPDPFRMVHPPVTVVVDLATLFPRQPHHGGSGYQPGGLQIHGVVDGQLTCWGSCEHGHWWGLVSYAIAFGARSRTVTHWIPAWMLQRKD